MVNVRRMKCFDAEQKGNINFVIFITFDQIVQLTAKRIGTKQHWKSYFREGAINTLVYSNSYC